MSLTPDRFAEFYEAVHGYGPFPWQKELARRVCESGWPSVIALPTASGKTACIDVAVYALACGAEAAARRIFFVVDRRIVVDQAKIHADGLVEALKKPASGIVAEVAASLCRIAGGNRPLGAYSLRGGIYRETAWVRSPLQPTVIASTVDQVGSRLLFRGYGVSDSMKPIHAGLVGNDSIILLDEAHCARPFEQTMRRVQRYRTSIEPTPVTFQFVTMTATPTDRVHESKIIRDGPADREHPVLGPRLKASKPAKLVIAEKATGKRGGIELAKVMAAEALAMSKEFACVGLIVNRVATARALARLLGEDAVLLTGRMRPLDRDTIFEDRLRPVLSNAPGTPPKYVVGTQCLECGADFDFHALVTECASLDALRQRFGRLNRVVRPDRKPPKAAVFVRGDQAGDSSDDPVYGPSLAATWNWINSKAKDGLFDFGVTAVREAMEGMTEDTVVVLNAPSPNAPVLFPAHLDCWVQTSPMPAVDPDPALFLHGPKTGVPDVQLVFRADLGTEHNLWEKVVGLCPPSSPEAVAVRIDVFRRWLAGKSEADESSDVEGEPGEPDPKLEAAGRSTLAWRGPGKKETRIIDDPDDVRPGLVYVLPCDAPDVAGLFDFRGETPTDLGDFAFRSSRDRAILRLPNLLINEEHEEFETRVSEAVGAALVFRPADWPKQAREHLLNRRKRLIAFYPGAAGGIVVQGKPRLHLTDPEFSENDASSVATERAVTLEQHSLGVARRATNYALALGLPGATYDAAGLLHDAGKLDPRFQAMLRDATVSWVGSSAPLAKSGRMPRPGEDRGLHGFPKGGRHELLSCDLLSRQTGDDLLLHLVATHHGHARPFASPLDEADPRQPPLRAELFGVELTSEDPGQRTAEWNADLSERFWRVVRRFGWWGAAYQEAVFRLADQAQSRDEQEAHPVDVLPRTSHPTLPPLQHRDGLEPLELPGLDGANPLAFLAALGVLRLADVAYDGRARLSWRKAGHWVPVLHLPPGATESALVESILAAVPFARAATNFTDDLKIPAGLYLSHQLGAELSSEGREFSDFLVSFADPNVTVAEGPNAGKTRPSAFYMIAGQQKFLEIARKILGETKVEHLAAALFSPWLYSDPVEKLSLRWDPQDDARYAMRWRNPSGDPARKKGGSMLGANRLAFESLPFFPAVARGSRLQTTGFTTRKRRTYFTWPIWSRALGVSSVRSLSALNELSEPRLVARRFAGFGVDAVFRAEKVANGDYSNFAPATSGSA